LAVAASAIVVMETPKKEKAGNASKLPGLQGVALQRQGACHNSDSKRKSDFIISAYHQDVWGDMQVVMPHSAPCGEGSTTPCRIGQHAMRERSTGPGYPLVVIRCHRHGKCFTVYPPGFVPYGRRRMPTKPEETATAPALQAARDAAAPTVARWPDWLAAQKRLGWASTQWRHLCRLGRWLGLAANTQLEAQRFATALQVPLHEHTAAREHYQRGGYRDRGRAVMRVLEAFVEVGHRWLHSLLRAAYLSGLYGRGFVADAHGRVRPAVPFS